MTYCDLGGCGRPADIIYGALVICAHHYKRCADYIPDATPERKAEIQAQVVELQGGAK